MVPIQKRISRLGRRTISNRLLGDGCSALVVVIVVVVVIFHLHQTAAATDARNWFVRIASSGIVHDDVTGIIGAGDVSLDAAGVSPGPTSVSGRQGDLDDGVQLPVNVGRQLQLLSRRRMFRSGRFKRRRGVIDMTFVIRCQLSLAASTAAGKTFVAICTVVVDLAALWRKFRILSNILRWHNFSVNQCRTFFIRECIRLR